MSSNLVVSVLQLVTCAVIGVGFLCGTSTARDHNQVENAADDSVTYRMVEHPESGATLPRVHLEEHPHVQRRVNRTLDSMAAEFQCSESRIERLVEKYDYMEHDDFEYDADAEVTHASDQVFSLFIDTYVVCGGPNPSYDVIGVTFDLRSGRRLALSDLFGNFKKRQSQIFALFVEELRTARLKVVRDADTPPAEESPNQDDCLQHELTIGHMREPYYFDIAFARKGLRVKADHASPACEPEATVRYRRLKQWARPGGALQMAGAK